MKPKVYVETTIISYLVAWPSRDVIVAAHQQMTDEWWRTKRQFFELFTSQRNCKHIANARMWGKIEQVCRARGYMPIIICIPEELMEA